MHVTLTLLQYSPYGGGLELTPQNLQAMHAFIAGGKRKIK